MTPAPGCYLAAAGSLAFSFSMTTGSFTRFLTLPSNTGFDIELELQPLGVEVGGEVDPHHLGVGGEGDVEGPAVGLD